MIIAQELALGIVYFKNVIQDGNDLIEKIESLDKKLSYSPVKVQTTVWQPWSYGDKTFCMKKTIPTLDSLFENNNFYDEQKYISEKVFNGIDAALNKYISFYPHVKSEAKSLERSTSLLKYSSGGHLPEHSDLGKSTRVISGVLYLNDNYQGGEIEFLYPHLKIKPEAGSCIFFPSNFTGVHRVNEVKEGLRYVMPHWFHHVVKENQVESDGSA
jgi:Rps23 Pro-64 3,4-dihydroxylase Tpa1-like proline 4-hydroxylase